jgi:hypothetical protein
MTKVEDLIPGTKWIRPESPNYFLTITEVYPVRVFGVNPDGNKFRCSLGVFLREFEPYVEPEDIDNLK